MKTLRELLIDMINRVGYPVLHTDEKVIDKYVTAIERMVGGKIDFAFNEPEKSPNNKEYVKGWNNSSQETLERMRGK